MKNIFLLLLLIFTFSFHQLFGANHFVDKDANGANTGLNWNDAWTSFQAIDWSVLGAGDTLFISGGTSSKTYSESMTVETSGSQGNPFVIMKGTVFPHNGKVIIKGDGYNNIAIKIEDQSWIIVKDLTVTDWYRAFFLGGSTGNGLHDVVIDNCDGTMAGRFIQAEGESGDNGNSCKHITIRNCDVNTYNNIDHQNDFIYAQYASDFLIEGNKVNISNEGPDEHNDCVQTYWVWGPVTIRNNYFEHSNHKLRHSQGIFFENHSGDFKIYNNIIVMPYQLDGKIYFKHNNLNDAHTIITNNTIYGFSGDFIKTTDPDAVIRDNILYTTGYGANGSSYVIRFNGVSGDNADVRNNLFYDPTNTMDLMDSGNCNDCLEDNPHFANKELGDFSLSGNSPAINSGISTNFNFDYLWNPRPEGGGWDIGAYEFTGVVSVESEETINPTDFKVGVYPNPFNSQFNVKISVGKEGLINIKLYNILGKVVKEIENEYLSAGEYTLNVNSNDIPSGVYFLGINSSLGRKTLKLIHMK